MTLLIRKVFLLLCLVIPTVTMAAKPVATDSRIKTFVYSENEVFRIVVHHGYQTSIEFANGESIQTLSVGNNYAWQLTPIGRRLFIRPLEENISTNMTLITNLRTYQFEIHSASLARTIDEELVYVVRFFYPDDDADQIKPRLQSSKQPEPTPVIKPYNFHYSLSGSAAHAPSRVFDDGINTFFRFDKALKVPLQVAVKTADGYKVLNVRRRGEFYLVNTVAAEFQIVVDGKIINVYNESLGG